MTIIGELNKDDGVDGILVQLPLPDHINERKVSKVVLLVLGAKLNFFLL